MVMFALKAQRLITPYRVIDKGALVVEDGRIKYVGFEQNVVIPEGVPVFDLGNKTLVPGFIDIHHHGAVGERASNGPAALRKIAAFLPSTGTTSWLPTVNAKEHCADIAQVMKEGTGGADIPGIHMEGPFLAPKGLPGAGEADAHLRQPDLHLLNEIQEKADGHVLLMGVGIEMDGALELIREMRRLNIVPAVAHTKADLKRFMEAVDAGLRHATHIYNVMTRLHHRRPGIVGGVLASDEITGEIIGDGYHVHPLALDIVLRCKGTDRVALITDQSELAGMPDGRYVRPNGIAVIKKDGICRMEGFDETVDNTMAGSTCTMDHNIRVMVNKVGLPLKDTVKIASLTPARIVGIDKSKGSLEPGKDADIVVLDEDLQVEATFVKGCKVYQR